MKIVKRIFDIVLVTFSVIGVFMGALYLYTKFNDKGLFKHSTSTYATTVTDPQTGEKLEPFQINYFANYNKTGKEVVEFRIRCYSDQRKTALYCRGFQLVDGTLYYYDSFDGQSWESAHKYDDTNEEGQQKTFFYVDIEDKIYAVRLDGKYYTYDVYYTAGDFFSTLWGCLTGNSHYIKYHTESVTHYYTYTDLLYKMASIVKSASYGTGNYTMPLIDLGDYLHVYEVDESGKVSDNPIGDGGLINSYFAMDVNYDKRGMSYADQSLYKSVAGDSEFNITGIDFDVNYWKVSQIYNLSQNDFVEKYSSVDGGYLYYLSSDKISELKKYEDIEVNITFDISKFKNKNVVGFDNYALYGIKVNKLTITNSNESTFRFMVGSLKDSGLTKVYTHNVTINNLSGLEVAYEVV